MWQPIESSARVPLATWPSLRKGATRIALDLERAARRHGPLPEPLGAQVEGQQAFLPLPADERLPPTASWLLHLVGLSFSLY